MTTTKDSESGTDDELGEILNCAYACIRVWEAWSVGTMTEDDFQPAAETAIRDDLIAWRDAAVQRALGEAERTATATPPNSVTYNLSDPDVLHVLTQALEDYGAKARDYAGREDASASFARWADLADRFRAQAEAVPRG